MLSFPAKETEASEDTRGRDSDLQVLLARKFDHRRPRCARSLSQPQVSFLELMTCELPYLCAWAAAAHTSAPECPLMAGANTL